MCGNPRQSRVSVRKSYVYTCQGRSLAVNEGGGHNNVRPLRSRAHNYLGGIIARVIVLGLCVRLRLFPRYGKR